MSVHQCPKCELKFAYRTELDYHCGNDHPGFTHHYPAAAPPALAAEEAPPRATVVHEKHKLSESLTGWLAPKHAK